MEVKTIDQIKAKLLNEAAGLVSADRKEVNPIKCVELVGQVQMLMNFDSDPILPLTKLSLILCVDQVMEARHAED